MTFDLRDEAERRAEGAYLVPAEGSSIGGGPYVSLWIGPYCGPITDDVAGLEETLRGVRWWLSGLLLTFAEDALRRCPVPGGMSQEEFEDVRRLNAMPQKWNHVAATETIADLLAHVDHLHRVMDVPESQEYARGYDDGRRSLEGLLGRAVAEMRRHDREYQHVTPRDLYAEMEAALGVRVLAPEE